MASPKLFVAVAAVFVAVMARVADAQISTGQNGVCCAFIRNSSNTGWQLVCNNPTNIPGASPFPAGTIISGRTVASNIVQCVGRFPYPNPTPYKLPATGVNLYSTPNGGKCAGKFSNFYQGLGADGGFVVQCT